MQLGDASTNLNTLRDGTLGAIAFQPAARCAEGNVAITDGAGKRNVLFEVGLKDGEPDHGLLSLSIRQTGERRGLCRFPHDPVPSRGRRTVQNFVRKGIVQRTGGARGRAHFKS